MSAIAIQLRNINKRYTIHHEKPTLVEKLIQSKSEVFYALQDVHLTITRGERVGIIGPNGSGKTTLLKIITKITTPTQGSVKTRGKIVSLIDLEAGFHPDLTGIQNVYLNGILLGMKKREIEAKLNEIIAFADIGKFIDIPLFTYSSGMILRLGFAIAASTNPDILLLDENLMVGDRVFQKKSLDKIHQFFHAGKTILIASQQLALIENNCDRVLIMKQGRISHDGKTKQMIRLYTQHI